jgi:hypothetical protein
MVIVEFARSAGLKEFLRDAPATFEGYLANAEDRAFGIGANGIHPSFAREVNLLFTGGTYGAEAGAFLFHVGLPVPNDFREDFLAWYHDEHLPILLEAPGWDGCRFVEEPVEQGLLFHALHQLSDRRALDSAERKRSRATPWFERLAQHAWFDKGFARTLYERYS